MSRFVMSKEDQTPIAMNKFEVGKEGHKKHLKNKKNNPVAEKFTHETADINSLLLKHFAPQAHHNMSNHIRPAPQCQVGTLEDDNCYTCVNINADLMSELIF